MDHLTDQLYRYILLYFAYFLSISANEAKWLYRPAARQTF